MKAQVVLVVAAVLATACLAQLPSTFFSGFVTVNQKSDANLFYYLVPSQSNPATDPVILWLQGGPGCSSLFGSWVENGPFVIQKDGTFAANPYSWNKNATVIWIDSPVGTGFSYVKDENYASDEKTIANDLLIALQAILFQRYPQFSANPFYIFGESYAGKYVPWLGSTVLAYNSQPKSKTKINLKAIAMGNGWVEPYIQTGSYAPFLYRHGRISEVGLEVAAGVYESYKAAIDGGLYDVAMVIGNDMLNALMVEAGVNDVYDIRKASDPTTALADKLGRWLNQPATKKLLNVSNDRKWGLCDTGPYFSLMSDMDRTSVLLFPGILAKIPILLYNGNYDLICNMDGTATYSTDLQWPGQSAFNNAPNTTWVGPNGPAGYYKSAQGLTRLVVDNAGHMVPFDQPANAQDMVWKYITGQFN
jgi:carboxypeptidase C (cathepsin A)